MGTDIYKHDGPRVLLVEGKTDCHVVMALCLAKTVPDTFGIYVCDSDDQVLRRMTQLINGAVRPEVIGVLLDSDKPEGCKDISSRWDSIKSALSRYDYDFPIIPNEAGTILTAKSVKTKLGVWLMPNNRDPGMLEDFLLGMISESEKTTVKKCISIAEAENAISFKPVHYSKACIHTYLAWQDEPGRPLGQSITCKTLAPETETAEAFVDWLRLLFCDE